MAILKSLPHMFGNLKWKDLADIEEWQKVVLLLPLGSTEAHGPHAPLSTDTTISMEVCLMSAEKLTRRGYRAFVLPPLAYAVTECASQFPGTISISPEVDTRLLSDICLSLVGGGFKNICIFNSHFEPVHVQCIYEAIDPSLINEERRKTLPRLPVNLVEKLFEQGLSKFKEFGMPAAYCGDPASASVEEGQMILERLSDFVLEDVEGLISGTGAQIHRGLYGRQKREEGQ
jgi:creatinine amidohydrolase